jgi:hypothetical protein
MYRSFRWSHSFGVHILFSVCTTALTIPFNRRNYRAFKSPKARLAEEYKDEAMAYAVISAFSRRTL